MVENALAAVVGLLALAGAAALLLLLLRGAVRLALETAEVIAANGLAEVSARRGDLTGMSERRERERAVRRSRQSTLFLSLLWLVWLIAPLVLGWAREAYAAAAPLWLLRPARGQPTSPARPPARQP